MPNVAAVLKEEITRLARKEARNQVAPLKKTIAAQRSTISDLKRRVAALERGSARANKAPRGSSAASAPASASTVRFSPKWVRSDRARLGLSAKDYAQLVEVSMLTIYNWEKGTSRPRAAALERWAKIRGIGKREALKRLDALSRA